MLEVVAAFAAFALIIAIVRLGKDLGLAIFAGSLILLAVLAPISIPSTLIATLLNTRTVYLIAISFTIALFAEVYEVTGLVNEMGLGLARALRSPLLAVMLVPAIVALLPVAGGALMSAPMIGGIGKAAGLSAGEMVFANVWFRHIVFLSYPLSQVMIVTSAMMGISVVTLAGVQAPILGFSVLAGYLLIGKKHSGRSLENVPEASIPLRYSLSPLVIAVLLALTLRYLIGPFGMPAGVALAIPLTIIASRKRIGGLGSTVLKALRRRRVWAITFTAYAIMLLQRSMVLTGASSALARLLSLVPAPTEVLYVVVPAVIAVLTGSTLSGVVLSVPMLPPLPNAVVAASLVYVSALIAYIGSPTHLCLIYTAKYFGGGSMRSSYKYLLASILSTLLFAYLYLTLVAQQFLLG